MVVTFPSQQLRVVSHDLPEHAGSFLLGKIWIIAFTLQNGYKRTYAEKEILLHSKGLLPLSGNILRPSSR